MGACFLGRAYGLRRCRTRRLEEHVSFETVLSFAVLLEPRLYCTRAAALPSG